MTKFVLKQPVEAMRLADFIDALEDFGVGVLEAHEYLPDGYSMDYAVNVTGFPGVCLYHDAEPDWMIPIAPEDWMVFLSDGPGANDGEIDIYENDLFVEMFEEADSQ